ncbi:MAG: hypothetical protein HFJ25_02950 [Clostridia bacterium]|nr:hypothetical protein [Clostridia bacterium]
MKNLISKDENIKQSIIYIGYLILSKLKKENKISIYTMYETLKNENIINTRQIMFALVFLYESNVIEFKESYICKV